MNRGWAGPDNPQDSGKTGRASPFARCRYEWPQQFANIAHHLKRDDVRNQTRQPQMPKIPLLYTHASALTDFFSCRRQLREMIDLASIRHGHREGGSMIFGS
jgi:hypothetical protein